MAGRRLDGSLPLNHGALRDRLTIQRATMAQNSMGEDVPTWSTFATINGQVRAMSGAEMERVQQRWAEARFRIRSWYIEGIQRSMRILWGDRTLDILDAEDTDGLRREIVITCRELVN